MKKYLLFYILSVIVCVSLGAQTTVGLLSYDVSKTYQGYTMIYPHNQANTYLLNTCGEIVHTWSDSTIYRPGVWAYLDDDGGLIRAKRNRDFSQDSIWAGGGGAIVEKRTWDNDPLWQIEINDENERMHHDIAVKPNGNILLIVWELLSKKDAIQAGRDTNLITQGKLWPDKIVEVDPNTDEVVWEWHVMDHLIQDFDDTKDNFGVISEHPEKVNFNWDSNGGKADWMHTNSIDYNAELRQIMISVPNFDEIWVIDNSTTTQEAASGFGGIYNKGGDLLYRFGNLQAYDKGDASDQLLFFQHNAHWTNKFIEPSHPMFGFMVCFNNRVGADFSSIEIFPSSFDMYINGYMQFQGAFPPFELTNTVTHPMPSSLYSTGLSSAQLLPNGNILVCSGRQGYIVELTESNEIVWEYITPLKAGLAVNQGTNLNLNDNLTFRAFKYPEDYEAFEGRDLSPKGYLENEPQEDWCDRLVSTTMPEETNAKIYPNPATDFLHISWDTGEIVDIKIIDILGRTRIHTKGNGGMKYLDIGILEENIYMISINNLATKKLIVRN